MIDPELIRTLRAQSEDCKNAGWSNAFINYRVIDALLAAVDAAQVSAVETQECAYRRGWDAATNLAARTAKEWSSDAAGMQLVYRLRAMKMAEAGPRYPYFPEGEGP